MYVQNRGITVGIVATNECSHCVIGVAILASSRPSVCRTTGAATRRPARPSRHHCPAAEWQCDRAGAVRPAVS